MAHRLQPGLAILGFRGPHFGLLTAPKLASKPGGHKMAPVVVELREYGTANLFYKGHLWQRVEKDSEDSEASEDSDQAESSRWYKCRYEQGRQFQRRVTGENAQ